MKINSTFLENELTLFSEDLNTYSEKKLISKKIKKETKEEFAINTQLKLSKNIAIVATDFQLKKPITDIFSISGEYVMISCVFKGESQLKKQQNKIIELGQTFFSYQTNNSELIKMPPSHTRYISLILNSKFYLKLLENENWAKNDDFYKNVISNNSILLGEKHVPLAFEFQKIVSDIMNCEWNSNLQLDYLELKLKEILLLIHYQTKTIDSKKHYNLSKQTIDKLKKAQAFLMSNYKNPPTIKMLSRIILLNEVELKKGFKELYGSTIRTYIIELRMKKAGELIKKNSVNDVAGILGYKSVPHFISTFKKYYGVTPKQLYSNFY